VTQQTFGRRLPGCPFASRSSADDGREALDDGIVIRAEAEDVPAAQAYLPVFLTRARLTGVSPFGLRCAPSISPTPVGSIPDRR